MAYKQKLGRGPIQGNGQGIPSGLLQQAPTDPVDSVMSGSSGYKKAVKEGTFANVPNELDEIVLYAGNDYKKQPNFNKLSKQERKLSKGSGPIARALRQKARGETPTDFTPSSVLSGITEGVGTVLQAPQSLAVEGVEALRGNDYSFKDAITTGKQRTPSQTIGFEDKKGWDLGGSLNTAMDIIADPSNLVGASAVSKLIKGGKNVGKIAKKGLSKATDKPISVTSRPNITDKTDLSGLVDLKSTSIKKLPPTPFSGNPLFDEAAMFFGKGKKQLEQLDPLIRELAEGAPTAASVKNQTLKNLKSTQGQQRLYNESVDNLKRADPKGKLSTRRLDRLAKKEVRQKTKNFEKVKNLNVDLAKSIGPDGKINKRKALNAIYKDFSGSRMINNASGGPGRFSLGTNLTKSKDVAAHEIQHNLQFGKASALDDELKTLKTVPGFGGDVNYFNQGGGRLQRLLAGGSMEPRAFGAELRQNMLDRGFVTNTNGTWGDITEESLTQAKKSFDKKPAGAIINDGKSFISGTRLLDFTDPLDYKKLAKSMNKLTGAVVPVASGAAYLNSNKKK